MAASNIKVITILDAKDSMVFTLDGDTAVTMYANIYCEYDDGMTTEAAFAGFVEAASIAFPRVVTCLGVAAQLDWWIVPETMSKTIQDSGLVDAINAAPTKLDLNDDDGVAMTNIEDYTNVDSSHPDYYLLVTDATTDTDTVVCQNGANDWIGYGAGHTFETVLGDPATTYADVNRTSAADADYALRYTDLAENTVIYSAILINIENYNIPDSVEITNIRIKGNAIITVDNATAYQTYTQCVMAIGKDATTNITDLAYSQNVCNLLWPAGDASVGFTFDWAGKFADLPSAPFVASGGEWAGGAILLKVKSWEKFRRWGTYEAPSITLTWKYLNVEFDYETDTFEASNAAITAATNPNILGTAVNYNDLGVAPGDAWAVGIDYNKAMAQAFISEQGLPSGLAFSINDGESYGKGVAKNFYGCTGWEMATQLLKDVDHHLWADPSARAVIIGDYTIMDEAVALNAPGTGSTAEVVQYPPAKVAVIWKGGIAYAATGVENAQGTLKISDEGIITPAGAEEQAALYATDAAVTKYSVVCKYTGTPLVADGALPHIGALYDVTFTKKDGTTQAFTDEPARHISIYNNGGDEQYETTVTLGRGSTPYHEKVPKLIMENKAAISAARFKAMSSSYSPISRHSGLNGVAGDADQYHVSSAEYTALEDAGNLTATAPVYTSATRQLLGGAAALSLKNDAAAALTSFSTDGTLGGNSDTDIPTEKAVKTYVDGKLSPGSIIMYGKSTAPVGWLLCDGAAISQSTYSALYDVIGTTFGVGDNANTFNVPDMRGVFPKGAGTTDRAAGKDANGNYYAGTLGTYLTDKMQGHWHETWYRGNMNSPAGANETYNAQSRAAAQVQTSTTDNYCQDPLADGTNGTPRTGLTTEPQSLGLTYIIKT